MAIESARLYDTSRRWARQLDSLNEVGSALVAEIEKAASPEEAATAVADRIRLLKQAARAGVSHRTTE